VERKRGRVVSRSRKGRRSHPKSAIFIEVTTLMLHKIIINSIQLCNSTTFDPKYLIITSLLNNNPITDYTQILNRSCFSSTPPS